MAHVGTTSGKVKGYAKPFRSGKAFTKVGDKFYFDGAGNLLTKHAPERVCVHALSALSGPMYVVNELFYAGADPNDMRLNRVGCLDVGVQCGGWGHVVMEVTMQDTADLNLP